MIRRASPMALLAVLALCQPAFALTPIALWVDVDGTAYLWNTTNGAVSIAGYQIASEFGDLDPLGWDSISDRFPERIDELIAQLGSGAILFGEANPGPRNLAELSLGGHGTLQAGDRFSLGKPFKSLPPPLRVMFFPDYGGIATTSGDVVYVPEPASGCLLAMAMAMLTATRIRGRNGGRQRLGIVEANFGNRWNQSAAALPEPATFSLLACSVLCWGALRFRQRGLVRALSVSTALCASVAPALAQPFYPLTYEARRASGPITLDGQLDEPAWAAADRVDQFSLYQQGTPPARPILARLLWDDTHLYASFELEDADLWAIDGHDAYLWESDVAELFFQPTPGAGPYYELEVSPKGDVLDLYWLERLTDFEGAKSYESGLEAVVNAHGTIASEAPTDFLHDDVDQGWTLELRVPRAALTAFSAGDEWGFLASAADYPRSPGESTLQFTSLLPAPFGFHTYERYERLAFVTEPWLVGDADGDGAVGLSDFGLLKAHFGQPGTRGDGEFTRDRRIDLADFGVLKAHFGNRVAAVPEPNSARLALAGIFASLWVGRRRPGGLRQFWAALL